jgi:hypothetical protein
MATGLCGSAERAASFELSSWAGQGISGQSPLPVWFANQPFPRFWTSYPIRSNPWFAFGIPCVMGDAHLLPAIVTVVLGGTRILGGRGTFLGTITGVILIPLL